CLPQDPTKSWPDYTRDETDKLNDLLACRRKHGVPGDKDENRQVRRYKQELRRPPSRSKEGRFAAAYTALRTADHLIRDIDKFSALYICVSIYVSAISESLSFVQATC